MTKASALKILNPILFCLTLVQVVTIPFIKMSILYEIMDFIHVWNPFLLTLVLLLHLYFNWSWVKTTYLKAKHKKPG